MSQELKTKDIYQRALLAIHKPAAYGDDVDLENFQAPLEAEHPPEITAEDQQRMLEVGITRETSQRSGTFIQVDNRPLISLTRQEGIEVMSTSQALAAYPWLEEYYWKATAVDSDKFTAHAGLNNADGYFIRALPHQKTVFPIQACLYLVREKSIQDVHNIIIAEEGSELNIITGCTTSHQKPGLHIGVSEFFIKKGARVTFTMIHHWAEETIVRPRTNVIIEDDGVYINNYINLVATRSLQTYPTADCRGERATARFNSILVAPAGSKMDVGSRVFLNGQGSNAEVISRALTTGGEVIARGYIGGHAEDARGHLECRGLILNDGGIIYAIPELKGTLAGVDLSHEAAIGKIAEEEVEYLMARGLGRDEATSAIIHGFLKVDIEGLPENLNKQIDRVVKTSQKEHL